MMNIGTALDLLAAAVSRRGGDFVYQAVGVDDRYLAGLYADDGASGCIVGQVLADANAMAVRVLDLVPDALFDRGLDLVSNPGE